MIIGGVAKIIVSYTLVGNPRVMIFGAPVGTLTCFVVVSVLNLLVIKRKVTNPPSYGKVFTKPLIASAVMAIAVWNVYALLERVLADSYLMNAVATAAAILAGVVVYLVLVLALRVISHDDLALMPKGEKIAKILHIK